MFAEITPGDVAYLAGLFDGEGCFCIHKAHGRSRRLSFALLAQINLTKRELLDWCQQITGFGQIYQARPATKKHAAYWQWYCNSRNAKLLAILIKDDLKLKRDQAQLVIDFPLIPLGGTRKGPRHPLSKLGQLVAYNRMRELNRKGPR